MKNFTLFAAGLALLCVGAAANAAPTSPTPAPMQNPRVLHLTIGHSVIDLQLPANDTPQPKTTYSYSAKTVRVSNDSLVLVGNAKIDFGQGCKANADKMVLSIKEKKVVAVSLDGNVVVDVLEEGKPVMHIGADKAVLEPQFSLPKSQG